MEIVHYLPRFQCLNISVYKSRETYGPFKRVKTPVLYNAFFFKYLANPPIRYLGRVSLQPKQGSIRQGTYLGTYVYR